SQYAGHMLTTADGQRLSLNGLLLEPGYALTSAPGGAMSDSGRVVSVARNPAGIWNVVRLDPATSAYPPPDPVVLTGTAHPATATAPWVAISLTWTASPTATAYVVERKGPTDAAFVALTPASGTIQTKYDDTAIAPQTSYTYRVLAIGLGGTGDPSNEVTVLSPPAMDTVPPVARITSPTNGAVVSGPVTVSATASDNVGLRGFEIHYQPNSGSEVLCGKAYTDLKLSDTLSCTWDPRYLPAGTTATLTAFAYDDLGNYVMSPISVTYNLAADTTQPPAVADTTAPKVTILEPANNATVSGIVTVRASGQDNVGVVLMEILDSSGKVLASSAQTGSITYLWDTSRLTKRQTLTVRARDAAGNIGSAKVTVRIGR
ncbi:MAG TPA: Ig-like domain-containing protein, partial [Burkholderiales bacterium]|nr:Ig-like domain-containing protein [Burkholderiales bacterium]